MNTVTSPANEALAPLSAQQRAFGLRDHASLWFSLGVGLLVMIGYCHRIKFTYRVIAEQNTTWVLPGNG